MTADTRPTRTNAKTEGRLEEIRRLFERYRRLARQSDAGSAVDIQDDATRPPRVTSGGTVGEESPDDPQGGARSSRR